ncbi:MAG: glycoside hydrolase family 127 protein, partial [Armatimonadota bacterium]|nr:glycoside hydrolase family 127 protein [Armatimonadota bacterium]
AEAGALGPLAAPLGKQFAAWDNLVERQYEAHMRRKARVREYGYSNYGDWFGERGRNWGNNEYDLAHGFFMQFARTGRRAYYRLALAAARHQADVDIVHAYPDPYYVGANHQHSIGHTGTWSQEPLHATWSHRYDMHTAADGGHTWAEGMVDAWYLAGDARVMESALALGEHITWAMSRTFRELGTHERSAGWSLVAIMALYRATGDPHYLEAAKRIVAVPLREQKLEQGGAWPHVLPRDHAGDTPGAVGNNLFLIGVLLAGLKAYHQETGDPAVWKSLEAGASWVLKSWDEAAAGWPYSATAEGKPLYKPSTSLNTLIIEPLAYVGTRNGDERILRVAEAGLRAVTGGNADSFGKSIGQAMVFTAGTLALLQRWYATQRPDRGATVMDGSDSTPEALAAKAPVAAAHRVRAPDLKRFAVRLNTTGAELKVVRLPHGAMTKRAEYGTARVLDADGRVVQNTRFSTDEAYEWRVALPGAVGTEYRVEVEDDQRGVWSLSGEGLGIVAQTVPGFRIGGVGRVRYHLFVPAGTRRFQVRLLGVHEGVYGAALFTPAGRCAGYYQGANEGPALVPGAPGVSASGSKVGSEQGTLAVVPAPEDTGKVWGLVLWAAGDIGVELEGVPPYLSCEPDAWFHPKR